MNRPNGALAGLVLGCSLLLAGCGGGGEPPKAGPEAGEPARPKPPEAAPAESLTLKSDSVVHHAALPARHTCDGAGTSPQLSWSNPAEGTASFVVLVDDPDAERNFVHWIVYNIPPDVRSLPEALPEGDVLQQAGGALQGRNDFGKNGWGAPCPTDGRPHRFVFRLYALDAMLDLPPGADRKAVEEAIKGHFRGQAAMISSYSRKG
jgi:hypothetical protein